VTGFTFSAFQLLLRDGRLHAVCYLRANDADQGLLSDVFSFTLLQEFAARQLGVPVGTYAHYAGSMHIADRDLPRIRQVLAETRDGDRRGPLFEFPAMPGDASWADLEAVRVHEELLRANRHRHTPATIAETGLRPYWREILLLFGLSPTPRNPHHHLAARRRAAGHPYPQRRGPVTDAR
jgi:thymidylate synthase